MTRLHELVAALLTVGCLGLLTACGGEAVRPEADVVTDAASGAGPASPINIAELFPAGRGRDLVLQNCQSCHTVVPILVLQMDPDQWTRNSLDHRERLPALADEDFTFLYEYLKANFNQDHPVPELPQALLETWTGY